MGLIHLSLVVAIALASAIPTHQEHQTTNLPSPPGLAAASVCNFHWDVVPAPRGSVQRCHSYLDGKGDAACAVPGGGGGGGPAYNMTQFCDAEDGTRTAVFGVTYKAGGTASSCADVARAVEAILASCSVEGQVAGQDTAHGNGDLLVFVQHGFYYNDTQWN